jgi:PBP1b-binding outer membrane lipoprotein LpoB
MKHTITAALLAVAVLLAGCGKSEMQTKLETELNDEITKLHDGAMATYNQAKDLTAEIDAAMANHTEMAAKYAKQFAGHSSDDLVAAKDKLAATVASMDAWMKEFKPYDPEMPHEQVIASLTKSKDDVMKMKTELETSVSEAMGVLNSHKTFAEQVMAGIKK